MKLGKLIQDCGVLAVQGPTDLEIGFVTNDSRQVRPGSLFVAVNGCGNDGRAYIDKAIENGAVAIAYEAPEGCDRPATACTVKRTSSLCSSALCVAASPVVPQTTMAAVPFSC